MKTRTKRLFVILLSLVLMLGLIPGMSMMVYADDTLNGSGTMTDPYQIGTKEDWEVFAGWIENGKNADKYYMQVNDINNISSMVGTKSSTPFKGTFDGNGYTLNVAINSTGEYVAPFKYADGATIMNVKVTGSVKGGKHCSGLVGTTMNSPVIIQSCEVAAKITAQELHWDGPRAMMGGFIGHGQGKSNTVCDCLFSGSFDKTLEGYYCVGIIYGWSGNNAKVENCLAYGYDTVDGDEWTNGFQIGRGVASSKMINCYARTNGTTEDLVDDLGSGWILIDNMAVPFRKQHYTVTYKVVNGAWSDDTMLDKTEAVIVGAKPDSVPTGMKAASGYTGGAWDTDPAETTITKATTFTYSFEAKTAAVVTKAPEAKALTYNGQTQVLINDGTAGGGTMQYAIGMDADTAPTSGWDTAIPTKNDAGTYYVWYKVKGDENHLDSEPDCVEAAIAKRNVTLTSAEDSKVYDGKPLTNDNITVTGDKWAEGEGATYNVTGTQTLPGSSDNEFTYTLNNNTKESNYNISKVINKLTVNDRTEKYEIKVEANSDNVTYDGNEHEVSGFKTLEFLCDGVTYTVSGLSASVKGTDAGTYDVAVTGTPLVKNSDDKDLTKQFIVNIVPGQLVIGTRNVSFKSASDTKQYDGEPLTNDYVEITGDGFAEGEGASFDVTGSQTVVGSSANTFTYTLNDGTNPANYNVTSQEGTLTVTNRDAKYEISPEANSGEFTYDGSEHSVTGFVSDTFEVATDEETTHIYTLSGLTAEGTGTDAGEYIVNVTGTPVVTDEEENDVSSQFSVTPVVGNIVVNKRNVTLTSASDSKAYDGKELTNAEVTVSGDGWAEGEGAEYKVTGTRKLPGETRNSFTYTLNEGTNADNYEITSVEGTLTITDRKAEDEEGSDKDVRYEITVVANSGNFTYDGTEHEVSGVESTEFIINDVTYTVSGLEASAKGTEVGTYPVKISGTPVVTDADGNDLTKQFTVNTKEGMLTVVEKSVNPKGDIRYSNYSGDGAVWAKGSNAGCEFVFKRSVDDELTFGRFTGIDVDSKAVDASNYTAVSGSVVITLKPEYLETLAVGDHLLTANFDDGNSVTVKFTIKEKSEEKKSDTTPDNKKADVTPGNKTTTKTDAPGTGDAVNLKLIFIVMILSMCDIFALCNLRSILEEKKRRR